MGKIDLGLDFIGVGAAKARGAAGTLCLAGGAELRAHFFRFMVFERTGMALLLGDSNLGKYIENRFAFDFQLPCQIVDSNLAHPPFPSYGLSPLSLHINLTASALSSARSLAPARENCTYCLSSEAAGSSADSAGSASPPVSLLLASTLPTSTGAASWPASSIVLSVASAGAAASASGLAADSSAPASAGIASPSAGAARDSTVATPAALNFSINPSPRPGTFSSGVDAEPTRADICCSTSCRFSSSLLISIFQPSSFAASRTFCPFLPMARESWLSSTTTSRCLSLASTTVTRLTFAGCSAFSAKVTASS